MPALRLQPSLLLLRLVIVYLVIVIISVFAFRTTITPTSMSLSLERRDRAVKRSCGPGEWRCGGGGDGGSIPDAQGAASSTVHCIGLNKFCDGIENCEDGSDEPLGCTNCNRTFIGEANVKYPIRVTGPFQRYLPFVCQISFAAAGKEYGDFVELTFLSFQIGSLEFTRNQTPICQKGYLKISEQKDDVQEDRKEASSYLQSLFSQRHILPSSSEYTQPMDVRTENSPGPYFGQFCGAMVERSVTFFSEGNNISAIAVVPSRASIPSSSFSLYLTYRFLSRRPTLSLMFEKGPSVYLGDPVPRTYCDKIFHDCSSNHRRCTIRSPNFPGFYPRNITCQYLVRQQHAPEGYQSRISVSQSNDYKISIPIGRSSTTTGNNYLLSTDCLGGDIVRIFDGPSVRSSILLEFCGSGSLPDVVSSGNEILVQIYSAPYQLLRSSRVEMDVRVRFVKPEMEELSHVDHKNGLCSHTIHGSRQRWGLVRSPNHSMPKNANCTFRFIGASSFDRIWLYFISFFAMVEKRPTPVGEDHEMCSSILELFDTSGSSNTTTSSLYNYKEPIASFCGETTPKMCAHAADYPPTYVPPRPCDPSTESYVSHGPEFVIRHRYLAPGSEVISTTSSSFIARFEFVDTTQSGSAIDHSECDRRIDSRLSKTGSFSNPRNVFLYGRGGRKSLACMYHFIGLPSERVRITFRKLSLVIENSTCKTQFDPIVQKYTCKWVRMSSTGPKSTSAAGANNDSFVSISSAEYWDGYSSMLGCLCNASMDLHHPPVVFESVVSNVKLSFTVNYMSLFKDFDDYGFQANFEFINSTLCDQGLRRHTGATGEGVLNFQVPSSIKYPDYEQYSSSRPVRCRWLIEASPYKYLYLKFKGLNTSSSDKCQLGNRILIFLDPRSQPVANACMDRRTKEEAVEFDIFSHTWYNESHGSDKNLRDRLFVEVMANPREPGRSSFDLHWLEVTKPFVRTQSGQTLRNVNCLYECPEIGACIDPELWCDGTLHCPSGLDESLEHCRTFPTAYVSSSAVGILLILLLIAWVIIRKRRAKRRLKKKDVRRLPQDDCLNMESPVG